MDTDAGLDRVGQTPEARAERVELLKLSAADVLTWNAGALLVRV